MLVGCYEISINVIVKPKQHLGIVWPFCLPMGETFLFFQCLGGENELLDCDLLEGTSTQADTILQAINPLRSMFLNNLILLPT